MTTAHRATWKAAQGGAGEEGSFSLHAPSTAVAARDIIGQAALKKRSREAATESTEELRRLLEERERFAKQSRHISASALPAISDIKVLTDSRSVELDADVELTSRSHEKSTPKNKDTWKNSFNVSAARLRAGSKDLHTLPGTSAFGHHGSRDHLPDIDSGSGDHDDLHLQDARILTDCSDDPLKNVAYALDQSRCDEPADNVDDDHSQVGRNVEGQFEDREVEFDNADGSEDDDENDEEDEDDDDDDQEDDDEEELRAELMRIRAERQAEKAAANSIRAASENPLLPHLAARQAVSSVDDDDDGGESVATAAPEFTVRRRWDDDVVFKNQARNEPKLEPRFVNDTIRNDFHRRFMKRYVR